MLLLLLASAEHCEQSAAEDLQSFDEYLDMQRGEFEYLQIACGLIVRAAEDLYCHATNLARIQAAAVVAEAAGLV